MFDTITKNIEDAPLFKLQHMTSTRNWKSKGKAIQLQALVGPEDSRRLRITHFKTIGT
jgi:hypothetical protein